MHSHPGDTWHLLVDYLRISSCALQVVRLEPSHILPSCTQQALTTEGAGCTSELSC